MLKVKNEKNVSLSDIMKEMMGIWQKYKRKAVDIDTFFNETVKEHRALYEAYPTVIKHMIYEGAFSERAFKIYLNKLQKKPWLSDEQRLKSYTDYYIILYKCTRRWTNSEIINLRKKYHGELEKEHKEFISKYEQSKKKVEEEEEKRTKEKRQILIEQFKMLAKKNNISEEKIKKIIELAENNDLPHEQLETINFQMFMNTLAV